MEIAETVFSLLLAVGSFFVVWHVRGKSWEIAFYKYSLISGIIVKIFICLLLYSVWPSLNQASDAALTYFPHTLRFLAGEVPYKDFESSYSILFHAFLAIPVSLWSSLGSVVLSMLLIETSMLVCYLYRCYRHNFQHGWLVAFLYSFSPISFYWVGMTGYNGPIIAFFVTLALILAECGKDVWASVSMALSFLCCKLLALLAWPGLVFYTRRRWLKRLLPAIALVVLLEVLPLIFGVDTLMPVKLQFFEMTSGNVWYLISAVFPGITKSWVFQVLPVASFALSFFPLFILFLRKNKAVAENGFDRAAAFITMINLLFMILSKKAYTFYVPMTLLFLIHTMVRYHAYSLRCVLPLVFMGATTTIEPYLYQSTDQHVWLFAVDTVLIGCYAYYAVLCYVVSLSSSGLKLQGENYLHTNEARLGRAFDGLGEL